MHLRKPRPDRKAAQPRRFALGTVSDNTYKVSQPAGAGGMMATKTFVALILVLTESTCFATDLPASPPTPADGLRKMGQAAVDELKKPEYAQARCMLSPVY